ncbi:MAG: hypothetical protein ACOC44_18885 [Promethearchaeia archaeon]
MKTEEIISIFKEMARNEFSGQEEKYKRKRKYKGHYCCTDDEVSELVGHFETLMGEVENLDYKEFKRLFDIEETEDGG